MNLLNKVLLATCLLGTLVSNVIAESLELSWDAPVTRENGSLLDPVEISSYQITAKYPDGTTETIEVPGDLVSRSIPIVNGEGIYEFTILTVDTEGLRSIPSPSVYTSILEKSPPSGTGTIRIRVVCEAGSTCNFYEAN
jgi:hypothetical protein